MVTPQDFGKLIRKHTLEMVARANASHIGSCLSMADILAVLYEEPVLKFDPSKPKWEGRDVLLVSKGHAAAIIYATLAQAGYFPVKDLEDYCRNGSLLQGHSSHYVPGVELSTGSLGHALPVACGMAIGALREKSDRRIFVILSDGELDEGSNWEAILFAAHNKLSNLTVIIDYNKIQSFGRVEEVIGLEPLADKWKAFNWEVTEIDGHDYTELNRAFTKVSKTRPHVVICNTIKGKGVSFMENKLEWHYKSPSAELLKQAMAEIG